MEHLAATRIFVVTVGAVLILGFVAAEVCSGEGGWDLAVPWADVLPPPIAEAPESDQPDPVRALQAPTYEEEVLALVNVERWNNGNLPPLKGETLLDNSSETHSSNMAVRDFFAHCDLDTGTTPWDRMTAAGYNWNSAAENIAAGQSTPTAVMASWMASSGHRANILSTDNRELGVGYVYQASDQGNIRRDQNGDCVADSFNNGPYFRYWTQNFGRRDSVMPVVINREAYETDAIDVVLYLYGTGWATQMRIRNESGTWTAWQPFAANVAWQLSLGAGVKQVFVEITNGSIVRSASDTILSTEESELIFEDGFETGDTTLWN